MPLIAYPSLRYYLDPASPDGLRTVEEPGRCSLYHAYLEVGQDELAKIHMEQCDICRAWLDRCQEIVMQTEIEGEVLEKRSQPGAETAGWDLTNHPGVRIVAE